MPCIEFTMNNYHSIKLMFYPSSEELEVPINDVEEELGPGEKSKRNALEIVILQSKPIFVLKHLMFSDKINLCLIIICAFYSGFAH